MKINVDTKKPFCPAPFVSQSVWANGKIGICCNDFGERFNSHEEEFNSDRRKKIQNLFLEGKIPEICKRCYEKSLMADYGTAIFYKHLYGEVYNEKLNVKDPIYLHFSPSNSCNLACKTCWGAASSTFARVYDGKKVSESVHHNDAEQYLKYLEKIVHNLEYFIFHGGEPMRDKYFDETIKILLKIKDTLNITILTNGTSTKSRNGSVIELLKPFKKLRLIISIDSIPSINEYIRRFIDTKKTIDNYILYKKELPNAKVAIHSVISNISLLYLDQFIDFLLEIDHKYGLDEFSFFILETPPIYRIETLPRFYKQKINDKLLHNSDLKIKIENSKFRYVFESMLKEIEARFLNPNNFEDIYWMEFIRHNRRFDTKSLIEPERLSNILVKA